MEGVGADTYARRSLVPFARGITNSGDQVSLIDELKYAPCDVAVIFGDVREGVGKGDRMKFKAEVKGRHIHRGLVVVDTPILSRATHVGVHYRRIGIDGLLRGEGKYRNENSSISRWNKIASEANLSMQPWKETGDRIILALQRPTDASIRFPEYRRPELYAKWVVRTVQSLRKASSRPVWLRAHPASFTNPEESRWISDLRSNLQGHVGWDDSSGSFVEALSNCWACVSFSSGSAVEAVIHGVPSFVQDSGSFAWEVSGHDVSSIESPPMPERTQWVSDLAWVEWSLEEMENGAPWQHLKPGLINE